MNVSINVFTVWMVELFGKLLLKRFVLALRMLNQRSIRLRIPKVTCLHFKPRLVNASGYHGPSSTKMRGLLMHVSSSLFRNHSASSLLLLHETRHAKTSLILHVYSSPDNELFPIQFQFSLVHGYGCSTHSLRLRKSLFQPPEP